MTALDITPLTFEELDPERRPSLRTALLPVLAVVLFLGVGSAVLKLDPHVPLLWSIIFVALLARHRLGFSWEEVGDGLARGLLMGRQALFIIFVIYALIATWISAGTIPTLMSYGLELLSPQVFLPVAAVLGFVVAFAIGSSWTTVGTLGVAFVGIGSGLGIPAPMTVGAVLSGAYAGDKQSPLSDTTNLAAGITNTDLYDHIRAMRNSTLVAFGLSVVIYAVLGLQVASGGAASGTVSEIQTALSGSYTLSLLAFLPLVVTFGLALRQYPALPTLVTGVIAGVVTTILLQGTGFVAAWEVFMYGTSPETGSELVNGLLGSGGLTGSAWTITVVVAALSLGGLLEKTGVLAVLAHELAQAVQSVGGLVAGTGAAAILTNVLTAQQYMSIVVPGLTLRDVYDEYGLDNEDLSQAIESAGTPTGALIPWHAGAVYMSQVTGVATLAGSYGLGGYAPYYFFGILSPLVLFAIAATGIGLPDPDAERASSSTSTPTPTTD
ncbi:Na+:H+ antiporter, NhaC family [Halogranum rubrum]|uniref:Na+:H+ antiporter, NhaC family n=2 Tax=Halogranum rubrum TaxID=553466 RepID=A0A1I4CCQ2_9EURY|nr:MULTISPECIES: Na+/H+ antiporter NhaC family protein [Halogranum]EJN58787.1 Na+/H+ antiporter NhaC [Halogranum salarium B-1]SFK78097.1 Na+:H+ antiporter, NhaC family [Halogranum rubrum]